MERADQPCRQLVVDGSSTQDDCEPANNQIKLCHEILLQRDRDYIT